MAWTRGNDTSIAHPQVGHLKEVVHGDPTITFERVVGFVYLCTTWSGAHLTDGWVPLSTAMLASDEPDLCAAAAVQVGLMTEVERDGRKGWLITSDPESLFHIRTKAEVERDREHGRAARTNPVRLEVLLRDGDRCRYCAKTVHPKDSRGARGRQLDHVDPDGPDTPENLVVSCRSCNRIKFDRPLAESGLTLLPPPDPADRYWTEATLAWLQDRTDDPAVTARQGSQPSAATDTQQAPDRAAAARGRVQDQRREQAPVRPDQPTSGPPTREVADDQRPGRDGSGGVWSGRDRTGAPGPAPPPARTKKRNRGKRAGRSRPRPPPD